MRRLLSFDHVRDKEVGLVGRGLSVLTRFSSTICFLGRETIARNGRLLCSRPRIICPTICNSGGELGRIFLGILSGTLGCAPGNNIITTRMVCDGSRPSVVGVMVASANYKVSTRSLPGIGRGFCGTGRAINNSKVKLTITSRVVGLRGNSLSVRDKRNINAAMALAFPMCGRNDRGSLPRGVGLWSCFSIRPGAREGDW